MRIRGQVSIKYFILGICILTVLFISLFSFVVSVHASEPSLTEIFNYFGFTNVTETTVETFPLGTYNITLYAEFAGYCDQNELSYYQLNTSVFNLIFAGPEGGSGYLSPPINRAFTTNYQFGLSLLTPEHRYFTETARNPDGEQHAKVYKNLDDPSMFLIGFENFYGAGDRDYNDMVFSLQLQYYLNVFSPYGTPSGEGWYSNGTYAYASLANDVVDHGNGTRRVFSHWSGDASGTIYSQSSPIYMNQNKTSIANWQTQHYLTLETNPLGVASPSGENWYDSGEYASISTDEYVDITLGESRYKFDGWTTSDMSEITDPTSPSTTVLMDKAKTVTANYVVQHLVTFNQTGLDSSAVGTTVTINGGPKTFSDLPFSMWVNESDIITYSYSSIVSSSEAGKKFILIGVTGPASPITVTESVTVIGDYKIRYEITFGQSGVDSDYGGIVVTIDGNDYRVSDLPVPFWWDQNSVHNFAFHLPLIVTPNAKQYLWVSTSGLSTLQSGSITVSTSGGVTGNYKTQFYLTVQTDPAGLSPTPTPSSGWHDKNVNVPLTAPDESYLASTKYLFDYWDVDGISQGSGTNPIIVYMNQTHEATAQYKLSTYTLTILPSAGGTTNPAAGDYLYTAGTDAIVEAVPDGGYQFAYWLLDSSNAGSDNPITVLMDNNHTLQPIFTQITYQLTITTTSGGATDPPSETYTYASGTTVEVAAIPNVEYKFDHWVLNGSPSGSDNPISIIMDNNYTLEAVFAGTHTLIISESEGGTIDPHPGTYVYETPTNVVVEAIPLADYSFDHWKYDGEDIGSDNPTTVYVGSSHTLQAVFVYSPPPSPPSVSINPLSASILVSDSVSFTSTVTGGTSPYTYQWYLNGVPVSGATSNSWTFTPPSTGIYYVYLKVTDANATTAQSDTAKVTVGTVPVGGYSVSLSKNVPTPHLINYTMVIALFGVALSLLRRKKK